MIKPDCATSMTAGQQQHKHSRHRRRARGTPGEGAAIKKKLPFKEDPTHAPPKWFI